MEMVHQQPIESHILIVRDMQVMLDSDLASLYQVETKVLNQAIKRNSNRFPESFRFQLTINEFNNLRSQNVTSSYDHGGRRHLPYVFTEQGVAMLSAVLRSDLAVQVSIQIMQAFVNMRQFFLNNASVFQRLNRIETKQLQTDEKFEQIFKALETGKVKPEMGIFFDGQIFDAYTFVSDLIKSADKSIILVDNYIDETVLTLLSKRKSGVSADIYTKEITPVLELDLKKYNHQYPLIGIKKLEKAHDRFIIIDHKELYHIGASLKDLGKKWFAFSRMDSLVNDILKRISYNGL
ncbi:MAG TPA: ORF6N domain-containing protein [Candidatus Cloacimonadota bacterium]|nr:ORF6N domain-containing protein [Candidatus Cloacimonadota bacterium]